MSMTQPRSAGELPELLPCPFCGGKPYVLPGDDGQALIRCGDCSARMVVGAVDRSTNWNRRAEARASVAAEPVGVARHRKTVAGRGIAVDPYREKVVCEASLSKDLPDGAKLYAAPVAAESEEEIPDWAHSNCFTLGCQAEAKGEPACRQHCMFREPEPVAAEGRAEQRMAHDFPKLSEFFNKHALGSLKAPSCLKCGQAKPFTISHAELPDIGLCADCAAPVAAEGRAEPVGSSECPMCHVAVPHSHTVDQVIDWLRIQAERFLNPGEKDAVVVGRTELPLPAGWKAMPTTLTKEMLDAVLETPLPADSGIRERIQRHYDALLRTAPNLAAPAAPGMRLVPEDLLNDVMDYFHERMDVKDGDGGMQEANEEMNLWNRLEWERMEPSK